MAEPFLGEVKIIGFTFAPKDWAECDGQLVQISQNPGLYSLLVTQFGGNGTSDFALPDMRSRTVIGSTSQIPQGFMGGLEMVTLTPSQIAQHTHTVLASSEVADSSLAYESNDMFSLSDNTCPIYGSATNLTMFSPLSVTSYGSNQSHINSQPSSVVKFAIALAGVYPSRS